MNTSISFAKRSIAALPGREAGRLEARDWRLLAFLIWSTHLAGPEGQRRLSYAELEPLLGLSSQAALRNALSAVRRILGATGRSDFIETSDATVDIACGNPLDSDLNRMLSACGEEDPLALVTVLGSITEATRTIEDLRTILRPRARAKRAQVSWLEDMLETLARNVPNSAPDGTDGAKRPAVGDDTAPYLNVCVEECASIDPRGLGKSSSAHDGSLPLEDVYISLVVGPGSEAEISADRELERIESTEGEPGNRAVVLAEEGLLLFNEAEEVHFSQLIRKSRWTVVLGKPGMGKTTFLQWLSLFHARALLAGDTRLEVSGEQLGLGSKSVDLGPARLPILVRVSDWAASGSEGEPPELLDYLAEQIAEKRDLDIDRTGAETLIRRWLGAGRALVLLDGLDEVADAVKRTDIVGRVERFVRTYVQDPLVGNTLDPWSEGSNEVEWWQVEFSAPSGSGGNQVVVASRENGYKEAPLGGPFQVVKAQALSLEAMERFCRRWCLVVERSRSRFSKLDSAEIERRASESAQLLIDALRGHENIRRLVENPLLLTVLAILQGDAARLPSTRIDLCAEASRVLLERRDVDWSEEDVKAVLGPLALWLHENRPRGHAPADAIRAQLRKGIKRVATRDIDEEVSAFLEAAERQAGLLVEVGPGEFGFAHATFREYFAAIEIARDRKSLPSWLKGHMHSARWGEVAVLAVAATAKHSQEDVEEILREFLQGRSGLEKLVHQDLLFVATCLVESPSTLAVLTTEVTAMMLAAARDADASGFEATRDELINMLRLLRRAHPRVALSGMVEALHDPEISPMATTVLADAPAETPGLLLGLDDACRSASRSPLATVARARVATELLKQGNELEAHLHPLGDLFAQYEGALEALKDSKLSPKLDDLSARVQPRLYGVLRWLLASVQADPMVAGSNDLIPRFCNKLREALSESVGADFSAVARLALDLEPRSTSEFLAKGFADARVDRESAARLYASHPEALPVQTELANWLSSLEPAQATALMRRHHPGASLRLIYLGWRWAGPEQPAEVREQARAFLCRTAAQFKELPITTTGLKTLAALLDGNDKDENVGRALLGVIGLDKGAENVGVLEAADEIARSSADPRATACALILAEVHGRNLTREQYLLLAKGLKSEEFLRTRILKCLSMTRAESTVGDETLALADSLSAESRSQGDLAAADIHSKVASQLVHKDGSRLIAGAKAGKEWAGTGLLTPNAARTVIGSLPDLEPKTAALLVDALRMRTRDCVPHGVSLQPVESLALESADAKLRCLSAALVAGELTLCDDFEGLRTFLESLRGLDAEAAIVALIFSAHCLPAARTDDLQAAASSLGALARKLYLRGGLRSSWGEAGARLAVDVLFASNPQAALHLLGERTTSHEEMATAVIFAMSVDQSLPRGFLDQDGATFRPENGLVMRRLREVCGTFSGGDREMSAVIAAAIAALETDDWQTKRAALMALDAAASAHPALFIKHAARGSLRQTVLTVGSDMRSFSTRRLAAAVLAHLRVLDQEALGVLSEVCRDSAWVSAEVVERCRSFEEAEELDIGKVLMLLDSASPIAIEAATTLLLSLTRSAPTNGIGLAQRDEAISALVKRVTSGDRILDCFSTAERRSLRRMLQEGLNSVVRDLPVISASRARLGATALARNWGPSELKRIHRTEQAPGRAISLSEIIREQVARNRASSAAPEFEVGDRKFGPHSQGFDDLSPEGCALLLRASYEALERRVGVALANRLSERQLDEFEIYFQVDDEKGAFTWLAKTAPDYPEVVAKEAHALDTELREHLNDLKALIRLLLGETDADETQG